MSSCAALGLNRLAPPSAFFTSWLWVGWLLSCQGAVGAYWVLRMLSVIEVVSGVLELDELDASAGFMAALGSVPFPPKKDWYQPRSVLELIAPATGKPPNLRA